MEQENLSNENTKEITTGGQVENNSQKELPNLPEELSTEKLTIENARGVDNLYEEYLKGTKVELPPWLVETGEGEKKKIDVLPQELYLYLKKNDHIKTVKLGNSRGTMLYHYDKKGYYKLWNESDCKAYIKSFIPTKIRNSSQWEKVYKEFITDYADTEESELNANEDIINFKNGILQLSTGKLLPHSPDYLCTRQIRYNYRPNLQLSKAPETLKYLRALTNRNVEDMYTILEVLGLIISNVPCTKFKKLLILVGLGDTGKSKIRKLAEHLVGEENCHTVSINQLNSKFGLGGIYGKRLIGDGDMEASRINNIDILKQLTGDDSINMELKFQNSFTSTYKGFTWFNCNKLPSFGGDRGKHVYERFLILSCNNVIPKEKQDPNLLDKLKDEKECEVTISVAIQFLKSAIDRGYTFTESEKTKQNRLKYEIQNNSLKLFLDKCCTIGKDRVTVSYFKTVYKEWCKTNNLIPEKSNSITDILVNEYGIVKGKSGTEYYELTIHED